MLHGRIVKLFSLGLLIAWLGFGTGCRPPNAAPATHDESAGEDHDDHDDPENPEGDDHVDEPGGDDHDDHDDLEADDHGEHVELSPDEMAEFGITIASAEGGVVRNVRELPGEIAFNPDQVAHVLPRVEGVVREVHRRIGDRVEAGDVLAELESRELAQAITDYLVALARQNLAELNFSREERLFGEQISTERSYLESRQVLDETRIETTRTERELHALGLAEAAIDALPNLPEERITSYNLIAPIGGMITERHLVKGEVISTESADPPFVVADLSSVWVNLTVYSADLADVQIGQSVAIRTVAGSLEAGGIIDFLSPSLDEHTRTASARVVLENPQHHWRPGMFVTTEVQIAEERFAVVVPRTALVMLDTETVIFVEEEAGEFEAVVVTLGQADATHVEIQTGIAAGDRYIAVGGFALKAEMSKASFEHAGHGH